MTVTAGNILQAGRSGKFPSQDGVMVVIIISDDGLCCRSLSWPSRTHRRGGALLQFLPEGGPGLTSSPPDGPTGLLEAALYASDLDAAEGFYGGVLGLARIIRADNRHVFFRAGAGVLLVFNPDETVKLPQNPALPVPPHGARGRGHVCLAVEGKDMDAWRGHIKEAGLPIEADFRWPNGARSLYLRDPAGNSVELAEPRLWADAQR